MRCAQARSITSALLRAPARRWTLPVLLVIASGCGSRRDQRATSPGPVVLPGVLVETDWLAAHLEEPWLVVLDARSPADYRAGHIPTAVSVPPETLLDRNPANDQNLAPIETVQAVLGQAGVDMARTVVVYGGIDYRPEARVFWVLEVHGHRAAAVLDGGYRKWMNEGRRTSVTPAPPSPRQFMANLQPDRLATRLQVLRSIVSPDTTILDARPTDDYLGKRSVAMRSGHIPRAVHVDFSDTFVDSAGACTIKSLDALLAVYSSFDPSDRVIAYCDTGTHASVSYLALRALGRDAAVYDGSWLEWGNDPSLPIESGAAPPLSATR